MNEAQLEAAMAVDVHASDAHNPDKSSAPASDPTAASLPQVQQAQQNSNGVSAMDSYSAHTAQQAGQLSDACVAEGNTVASQGPAVAAAAASDGGRDEVAKSAEENDKAELTGGAVASAVGQADEKVANATSADEKAASDKPAEDKAADEKPADVLEQEEEDKHNSNYLVGLTKLFSCL